MGKNSLQVCSTNKYESKSIIIDESSMEESESECTHKTINKEKYANNEEEYEEPAVMYDPVVKELSCF